MIKVKSWQVFAKLLEVEKSAQHYETGGHWRLLQCHFYLILALKKKLNYNSFLANFTHHYDKSTDSELNNPLIDKSKLHPEIYDKAHVNHSYKDSPIAVFEGSAAIFWNNK